MSIEKRFHAALLTAAQECRQIDYHPSYFLRMLDERGPLETARHLITSPHPSDGFTKLWEKKRLDLSVEAIALQPEFQELFSSTELERATRRLQDYGHLAR